MRKVSGRRVDQAAAGREDVVDGALNGLGVHGFAVGDGAVVEDAFGGEQRCGGANAGGGEAEG